MKDSKLIKVLVTNDDTYMIDDTEIPEANLASVIAEQAAVNTDGLLIMTQDEASHGAVVKLMDEARNSGVTNISITEY